MSKKKVVDNKLFSTMRIEEIRCPYIILNLENDIYGSNKYVVISKYRDQIDRLTNALTNIDSANINFDIMLNPFISWTDNGDLCSFVPTPGTYVVDYDIIRSVVDENSLLVEIRALRAYSEVCRYLSSILELRINELENQIRELLTVDDPDYEALPYGYYDNICTSYSTFSSFVLDSMKLY